MFQVPRQFVHAVAAVFWIVDSPSIHIRVVLHFLSANFRSHLS